MPADLIELWRRKAASTGVPPSLSIQITRRIMLGSDFWLLEQELRTLVGAGLALPSSFTASAAAKLRRHGKPQTPYFLGLSRGRNTGAGQAQPLREETCTPQSGPTAYPNRIWKVGRMAPEHPAGFTRLITPPELRALPTLRISEFQPQSELHDTRIIGAGHLAIADIVGAVARGTRSRQSAAREVD